MSFSDELLLDRWRRRDTKAFEMLFLRHHESIYRMVYALVRNREEAEDIAQDAFLVLHDRPPRICNPGGLLPWLRRVALNRGYSLLRTESGRRQRLERYADEPAAPAVDPQDEVIRAEDQQRIRRALMTLPERSRSLILLRQAGLSYAEVAAVLCLSSGSVGTLLTRAERALLKAYEAESSAQSGRPRALRSVL